MGARPSNKSSQAEKGVLAVHTSHAQARAFYNRLSPLYDFLTERWEGPVRTQGLALLRAGPGEKIREIGVGTGHGVLALARAVGPTGRISGIDIAEKMLDQTRRRLHRAGLSQRVELIRAEATTLPYATQTVDAVFMSFTLELFATPEIALVLRECHRVLRGGGRLVVVSLSRSLGASLPIRLYEWGHRSFPRLLDCRPICAAGSMREAGFRIETVEIKRVAGLPVEIALGKVD